MSYVTLIIAAAAWIIGFVIAYLVCRSNIKELQRTIRKLRKDGNAKTKMGAMDKILILEAIILILYTIADMILFWHTGNEPMALTGCVFGVCGLENGVMGWIKTNKDKLGDSTSSGSIPPPPQNMP